jgi:hypothetical protein
MRRTEYNLEELRNREKNLELIAKRTRKKLRNLGLNPVEQPKNSLEVPLDVTKLDSRSLGKLFQRSVAWENYAGDQLAYARVAAMLADYAYDRALNDAVAHAEGGVQQRRANALTARPVRYAKLASLECAARVLTMEAQFSRYTRTSQALSREQTRREKLLQGD